MEINKSINHKNLDEIVLKSLIYNSVFEIYFDKKNVDLKPYFVSVKILWNRIIFKVSKTIIRNEINLFRDEITESIQNKLQKIWIKFYDFELKFVV